MLCSSGGHFNKLADGWEYTGGETRLVSVSSDCHMQELQDALHRVSQTMRLDLSSSSASVSLKDTLNVLLKQGCCCSATTVLESQLSSSGQCLGQLPFAIFISEPRNKSPDCLNVAQSPQHSQ